MKTKLARLLLGLLIAVEVVWFIAPRGGSSPVSPRVRQAIESHKNSPATEMQAAIDEAMEQDTAGGGRKAIVFFAFVVAINVAFVYLFWNYGFKKTAA